MRAPLILQLATLAQGAPPVTAFVSGQRVSGARVWVIAWCTLLLGLDILARWLGMHHTHNLWLAYVLAPASGVLTLWALSGWQSGEIPRLAMRFAVLPFILVSFVVQLAMEQATEFSRAAQPLASLLCLTAAAYTLLARSRSATRPLAHQEWFWVSAGMALYYAFSGMIGPLSVILVGDDLRLLALAYEFRAAIEVLAFILIAVGMTCPSET